MPLQADATLYHILYYDTEQKSENPTFPEGTILYLKYEMPKLTLNCWVSI